MTELSIRHSLQQAAITLSGNAQANPPLEAEVLLAFALGKPRSYLHTWPDRLLGAEQQERFQALIGRRADGEPIAYITGRREFWSLELEVTPATLIPRPETELLVEQALALIPTATPARVADLGTGCGAIAAAIAHERRHAQVIAVDHSPAALAVARSNFKRLQLSNVETRGGDWCDALGADKRLDLIVSNPPYIADNDPHLRQGDLPREPRTALAAGPDGLDAIRRIVAQAPRYLHPGGWLLLEHGLDQGAAVRELMERAGLCSVHTLRDLAGLDRVTAGQAPNNNRQSL